MHQPRRGDEVEAWLKGWRDEYYVEPEYAGFESYRDFFAYWAVLDDMLDDYRLHADTGTPLGTVP